MSVCTEDSPGSVGGCGCGGNAPFSCNRGIYVKLTSYILSGGPRGTKLTYDIYTYTRGITSD